MQHEHHRVPVTALAFWNRNVLLAGDGTFLKAYDTEKRNLLTAIDVLPDQAIHGIIADDDFIFVWGGRLLCQLVPVFDSDGSLKFDASSVVEAEDWILDASFSPVPHEGKYSRRVALVTAHNSLAIVALSTSRGADLRTLVPGSNCILYAAHVTWLSASQCLIASGTAFGDVIVWSYSFESRDGQTSHQTHFNFSAHEGSIFGVRIASRCTASALGGRKHVLASCSDDRTIRLWDISNLTCTTPVLSEGGRRETGFGLKSEDDASAPTCLSKTMGHMSRIWQVYFLPDQPEDLSLGKSVHVVSFGEDASCISWILRPESAHNSAYLLEQLEVQKSHNGKNIWSVAIDTRHRVATGGADGSITLRSLGDLKCHGVPGEISGDVLDSDNQADGLRTYAFVNASTLIATTNSGRMLLFAFETGGYISVKEIRSATGDLRGYSTMASTPAVAFSGGTQGSVYAYIHDRRKVVKIIETGAKVAGLFTQPSNLSDGTALESLEVLITNVSSRSALLCHLEDVSSSSEAEGTLEVVKSSLTLPPSFIVTSFAHTRRDDRSFVVLGSRGGSIAVYWASNLAQDLSTTDGLLYASAHGKEAVTSLCFTASEGAYSSNVSFFSTGRDGSYAVHEVDLTSEDAALQTVHQLSLPFGPNVEGIGYSPGGHLWVWGFRSKQFVVWDINSQLEVMQVECGGANRNWAFQIGESGSTFVWTKAGKVYHETHSRLPFHSLNPGGHGREIKSLAISPLDSQLIATGAEDTDIKLSTYHDGTMRCLHTLQKHNTGIQHLQWSLDGHYLFSSGGFEEFHIWKINYNVPTLHIGVVCESSHPNSGKSDLRVMHFGAVNFSEEDFNITMVYSDSSVRAWRYVSKTWSFLAVGNYLTSCLTQCLPVKYGEISLITSSTDGYLTTWRSAVVQESVEWTARHRVHQSAILSMMSHDLSDGSQLIFTGGDDNAIGITRTGGSGRETRTLFVPRAHAAAVTALAIVSKQSNRLHIVSASIDQRVRLWQVDMDVTQPGIDGIDIKLLKNCFTPVADVSSIETIALPGGNRGVLVCGVGMDIWKLEHD